MAKHDQVVEELCQLGLTSAQARVYVATLCMGSATARQIANHCPMDQSVAYRRLKELVRLGLVREELGTPNSYVGRDLKGSLAELVAKAQAELVSKVQAADRLEGELLQLRDFAERSEPTAEVSAMSYRLVRGRGQVLREAAKYSRAARKEILLLLPSRGVSRIVNTDRIDLIREAAGRGVTVRVVAEVSEADRRDSEVLAKAVELRRCDFLPLRIGIFDRRSAYVGAIRDSDIAPDDGDDPYLVVNDSGFAAAYSFLFDAVWARSLPAGWEAEKASTPAGALT